MARLSVASHTVRDVAIVGAHVCRGQGRSQTPVSFMSTRLCPQLVFFLIELQRSLVFTLSAAICV
eukprot:4577919-Prymnesium_polylepis.1